MHYMSDITRIAAALLAVGIGLALTPHAKASLLFNGSNSKATLDGNYLDGTDHSNYTFEVWIKPYSTGGGEVFGKTDYWDEWDLTVLPEGELCFEGSWPYYYWVTETAVGSITTNEWQHICCAVTNGQASFYVNGNLVGTEAVQNPINFYASTNIGAMAPYSFDGLMPIGYADSGTTPDYNFFSGLIYGIKIWSRTLSAGEVMAIATTGIPLSTNGLCNAVMLNEGSGTILHDSLTSLTGQVLSAQWSSDKPTFQSSFTTNGLIAYYPFNGNANDASGNGINGTVYGATLASDRFGNPNAAYYFNGSSAYIDYGNPPSLSVSNALTLTAWVAPLNGGPLDQIIACKEHEYWLAINSSSDPTSHLACAVSYQENGEFVWLANNSQASIPRGGWTHVAMVYNGTTITLYSNGVSIASFPVGGPITNSSPGYDLADFIIGWRQEGEAEYFNGSIDDVRIYNRALSSNEVTELYAIESTPPPPPSFITNGLVAYYPLNGNANDASGYSNNPVVNTASLTANRFGWPNSAYLFSGSQSIQYASEPQIQIITNITVSCWMQTTSSYIGGYHGLVCKEAPSNPQTGFQLGLDGNAVGTEVASTGLYGTVAVNDGSWHAVCGIFDYTGEQLSIYVDGQLYNSDATPISLPGSTYPLYVGVERELNYFFVGSISDVRIYNRALSSNEVAQLYAYESVPSGAAPTITTQPADQTANQGNPVSFNVTAAGTGLNYQWQFNTANISGATNAIYTIADATTNNGGNYDVVVSSAGGSVTSSNAVLTVIPPPRTGTGTATLSGSFVTIVTITDGGIGYTNAPLIRFIGGGGSGAEAFAVISNGTLISITVTNAGYGYTNPPLVVIDPPFISNPVLGIAPMTFLSFSSLAIGGEYQLQQLNVWYWTNQPVSFIATNSLYTQMVPGVNGDYRLALNPVPTQAFATARLDSDFVVGATITSGGSGYVNSPVITVVGGGGVGAEGFATILDGVVTSITFTNAGYGYTNTPTIQIAPPPAAAVAPTEYPVMRVDAASLAPYDNYQVQFKPLIDGSWANWNGGLFTPSASTNSQFICITNGAGFFRVQYAP